MSNRSLLEFNHDVVPVGDAETLAWAKQITSYLSTGDRSALPKGVTFFHQRHHSERCPLGDPPHGWNNEDALKHNADRMTPRQCLQFQVDRQFHGMMGCRNHEMIAASLLLTMAIYNHWNVTFCVREFVPSDTDKWSHEHHGMDEVSYPCSFDKYVTYNESRTHFSVNQLFIDKVQVRFIST